MTIQIKSKSLRGLLRKAKLIWFTSLLSFVFVNCQTTSTQEQASDNTPLSSAKEAQPTPPQNTEIIPQPSEQTVAPTKEKQPEQTVDKESLSDKIKEGFLPPSDGNTLLTYSVEKGDTLGSIAKKIYNKASMFKKLAQINNLTNPDKIYVGDVIYYELSEQSSTFAQKYEDLVAARIEIKKGDTLSSISKEIYGTSLKWRTLWKSNPQINNPNKIKESEYIYFKTTFEKAQMIEKVKDKKFAENQSTTQYQNHSEDHAKPLEHQGQSEL